MVSVQIKKEGQNHFISIFLVDKKQENGSDLMLQISCFCFHFLLLVQEVGKEKPTATIVYSIQSLDPLLLIECCTIVGCCLSSQFVFLWSALPSKRNVGSDLCTRG